MSTTTQRTAPPDKTPRTTDHIVTPSTASRPPFWKLAVAVVAAVVAGLVVVLIVGPRLLGAATPHFYAGTVLQQSAPAPALDDLQMGDGTPVDLAGFEGSVVLLYFGYTSCPDVCPTTLSIASQAMADLDDEQVERVRLIMVSVDAERDDPALVQEYAEFFHPTFLGAGGSAEALLNAATRYGIFYDLASPDDPAKPHEYFVDHTSTLMAIDTSGALRVVWAPDATADEISGDLKELLKS